MSTLPVLTQDLCGEIIERYPRSFKHLLSLGEVCKAWKKEVEKVILDMLRYINWTIYTVSTLDPRYEYPVNVIAVLGSTYHIDFISYIDSVHGFGGETGAAIYACLKGEDVAYSNGILKKGYFGIPVTACTPSEFERKLKLTVYNPTIETSYSESEDLGDYDLAVYNLESEDEEMEDILVM